jgi:glc operon protein GlcG
MIRFSVAMATAAVFLSPLSSHAQTPAPPPAYGPGIGLDDAKKMLAAAEAEAKKNGWLMAIAVVDSGGKLVAFSRMDNTQLVSIDIAVGKAVTANNFKRPTKVLQEGLAAGGASLRTLAVPGVTPIDGGLPIIVAGKIVGAIGVSGAAANQDAEVAAAGLAAVTAK